MSAERTPTLQVAGQYPNATFVCSQGKGADVIAKCDGGECNKLDHAANAARIVLTWNAHDALVRALVCRMAYNARAKNLNAVLRHHGWKRSEEGALSFVIRITDEALAMSRP